MRTALPLLLVVTACTPRVTTIGTNDAGHRDQTMTLTGRVCSHTPDPTGFATKVVVLLDQSGSNCLTDPPGSQPGNTFCQQVTPPPGVTVPRRVQALQQLVTQLGQIPSVSLALVPFDTNVTGVWPSGSGSFSPLGDPGLPARIATLQNELGKASDLQGALEVAHSIITADVTALQAIDPAQLPRSRYVVVVVTDGPPLPRCSANDTLSVFADDTHPDLTWPDSSSYCNTATPLDAEGITGFVGGQDRNQNEQLFEIVERLRALRTQYLVGDVQVNTALLFNRDQLALCGPSCNDLYGEHLRWPGPTAVPAAEGPEFTRTEGSWLLRELARRGGGVFTEFLDNAGIATIALTQYDYRTLASRDVLKRLVVQPARAVVLEGAWVADLDGDGVADVIEADAGTDVRNADTDGDGFDDQLELERRGAGFDPLVKDLRGCEPSSPLTPGCVARDTDGDGLSQYAEAYLGLEATLADTDRDGFNDGFELRAGLDPRVPLSSAADSDGDGLSDVVELRRGSDPRRADRAFSDQLGIEITVDEQVQPDESTCSTFTASNLPLRPGYNLYKVWFTSAPEAVTNDIGSWKVACAWARKDGEIYQPPGFTLDLPNSSFVSPRGLEPALLGCAGVSP